ncbi:unnamed protein product [Hymenolepis diminuta]|uniref:BRCT domain-containing protein n=1 Tax=Hymenolepis diminuta TaxID=6216 RepID=A0A0R3SAJ6_HYMDI|nr:unnamed protein product [Hymenolepis diminuta]
MRGHTPVAEFIKRCYVPDRTINLVSLDWIDDLELSSSQTPTLEPINAENLVRGCNRMPKSFILLFLLNRLNLILSGFGS